MLSSRAVSRVCSLIVTLQERFATVGARPVFTKRKQERKKGEKNTKPSPSLCRKRLVFFQWLCKSARHSRAICCASSCPWCERRGESSISKTDERSLQNVRRCADRCLRVPPSCRSSPTSPTPRTKCSPSKMASTRSKELSIP